MSSTGRRRWRRASSGEWAWPVFVFPFLSLPDLAVRRGFENTQI